MESAKTALETFANEIDLNATSAGVLACAAVADFAVIFVGVLVSLYSLIHE